MRGGWGGDFEDAAPLGEPTTPVTVLGTAAGQIVQTLGGALVEGARQFHEVKVRFYTWDDFPVLEEAKFKWVF